MRGRVIALLLLATCAGCVNLYTHVDTVPGEKPGTVVEASFEGIRDYLREERELHVLQMHGMGDHPAEKDCGENSLNLKLQDRIAQRLGFVPGDASGLQPIWIGGTVGGSYSTRRFHDSTGKTLYFSCLTWGEASRVVKQRMLGLTDDFNEDNANEAHRAPLNRAAKRFVNESFSDPVIYLGTFGAFQREIVWKGLQQAGAAQGQARLARLQLASANKDVATGFYGEVDMVVISDSLGSRVIFDVLCQYQGCREPGAKAELRSQSQQEAASTAQSISGSMRSLYMFANQLPLLELAFIEAPTEERSLEQILGKDGGNVACFRPPLPNPREGGRAQVIAFTDANDALSYHLSPEFKDRCEGSLHIVNVTLPNARLRWLFAYAHLPKAHSMGFKTNDRAIDYLVDGNHPAR